MEFFVIALPKSVLALGRTHALFDYGQFVVCRHYAAFPFRIAALEGSL